MFSYSRHVIVFLYNIYGECGPNTVEHCHSLSKEIFFVLRCSVLEEIMLLSLIAYYHAGRPSSVKVGSVENCEYAQYMSND